ncbi:MAG TPA: glycogen debranching N-terminal domain-containing protein, partial [Gemmatimonadales bacterium]|nr:glycogen debranching N-terminal domain-containing protein [Gemmatimonadales bacterium]
MKQPEILPEKTSFHGLMHLLRGGVYVHSVTMARCAYARGIWTLSRHFSQDWNVQIRLERRVRTRMRSGDVTTIHGSTFMVSDQRGDVQSTPDAPAGLFHADTRHLSRWILQVNGRRPLGISYAEQAPYATRFWLVPGGFSPARPAPVSIVRSRV